MIPPLIGVGEFRKMLPNALEQASRRHRAHGADAERSSERCGCCPICHDFVQAEFVQPGGLAACPHCGGLIGALEPLG